MPHFFADGSIETSNISLGVRKTSYERRYDNFSIIKARVEEVLYTDDSRNSTYNTASPQVQYICTVISGPDTGKKLFNVTDTTFGGGVNNSSYRVRSALTNEDSSGRTKKSHDKTQGEIVIISRLNGVIDAPIIVGSLKHPRSTFAPKQNDGQCLNWEFNGFSLSIDKDGALSASYGGGPKNSSGTAANSSAAGAKITFDKSGGISFVDKDGNGMSIDGSNKKVTLKGGTGGMDVSSGGGWNIDVTGSARINAGGTLDLGGAIVNIGGSGMQAARMNDLVIGVDSQGGPINAYIGIGSSTVLIGG